MKTLKIGDAALASGVGIETIHFHEPDEQVIRRLRFIRQSKELGFTRGEIRELLKFGSPPAVAASTYGSWQRGSSGRSSIRSRAFTPCGVP